MEDWPLFASTVKVGNRVKFTGDLGIKIKKEIATADLPEVRLISSSAAPHLQRTSNGTSVIATYEWQISTGDQRLDAVLFPLKWAMLRAMSDWQATLRALTWNSKTFVRLLRSGLAADGELESDLTRGVKGWSIIWSCTVELWFTTVDLQNQAIS